MDEDVEGDEDEGGGDDTGAEAAVVNTRGDGTVGGAAAGTSAACRLCVTSTVFMASSSVRYRHAAAPTVARPSSTHAVLDPVRACRPNSIAMKTSTPQATSVTVMPPARRKSPRPGEEGAEETEEERVIGRSGPRATRRPEYLLMSSTLLLTSEVGVTRTSGA